MEQKSDFEQRPFVVIWETTQACDLACVHCRACAQPVRSSLELTSAEGKRLIDEVAALEAPVFVLTGGDPLKRPDIFELVEHATKQGVRTSLTPSAAPLLRQVIGLENRDAVSTEFRPFKQLIERLNRTYKYHLRPACGFATRNRALALTTLFVTHYNFLRPHLTLGSRVPVSVPELSSVLTLQGKWNKILELALAA